jgi:HAMP domain-containing protein
MEAFGTVLIVISLLAVIIAAISFYGSGRIYRGLGRTGAFSMDEDEGRPAARPPQGAAAEAEAREEIRQMLEAKSARREARGEAPLDIDAELASLSSPSVRADEGLRDEVRQLVEARNERRLRQGKEPLDVETEVDRQLRELGG